MCGIAGIWNPNGIVYESDLHHIAAALAHRGPDGEGKWLDATASIGFAHRRLAILDLSAAGHQPMHSQNGRWVISYNGELYNFQALRQELQKERPIIWKGHSDTEVLLEAIARWGIEDTLRRTNGMFAFAVWDKEERKLYLARDRMGEKPLYIAFLGTGVAFASELKAFRQLKFFETSVDRVAAGLFFRYGYVPSPYSIYSNTYKLHPGRYITIDMDFALKRPSAQAFAQRCRTYWSLTEVAIQGAASQFPRLEESYLEQLEARLCAAVAQRLVADVPVGAFLSGGIDSSLIVALMQQQSATPVKTFTIGFNEACFDESPYAAAVAAQLGTEHHAVHFRPRDALECIPFVAKVYDEPFADSSQLPTMMLAEVARANVTVSLSGDGADELFGGYPRYITAMKHWSSYRKIPEFARSMAGALLIHAGNHAGNGLSRRLGRFGRAISSNRSGNVYRSLIEIWPFPENLIVGLHNSDLRTLSSPYDSGADLGDSEMLLADQLAYLPDDLMVKTDRASMASSLEVRIPFLDPDVIALSWRISLQEKLKGGIGKSPLKTLLRKYLPNELIDRPKQGFNAPVGEWLRSSLRAWADELLSPSRLRQEGFLHIGKTQALWKRHLAGNDESQALWTLISFQSWLSANKSMHRETKSHG